ncbi:MAG: glycosyltransferase [Thermoleophilia bacterium]
MSHPLHIAVVSPHSMPPRDDVAHHVEAEAAALAARGHGVTLVAPSTDRAAVTDGRAVLRRVERGEGDALLTPYGRMRTVAIGRGLPAGAGRRVGDPFDLAGAFETVLSRTPFDVVHLHEPLASSPALAAVRHAGGVTVATFHRPEPLVGVAFLRPLVDRSLGRINLRIATTEVGRRALSQMLPGAYSVIPPGVDLDLFADAGGSPDGPSGLVLVARGRDRAGVRFAMGVLRTLDLDAVGPVALLGPQDAPWRTRAAVPKAFRDAVTVVPDEGPAARAGALARGSIVLLATPEDASGPVLREAMAMGRVIIAPRCPTIEEVVRHGSEAVILPPFTRNAWSAAVSELAPDGERRRTLARRARRRGSRRGWAEAARDLEAAYRDALAGAPGEAADAADRVVADLRVRCGAALTPSAALAACRERGIDVIAVASPLGIAPAIAAARSAPDDITVIVGQEIATSDGSLVGLFLSHDVPEGLSPAETAAAVHDQGGLVMVPHPDGEPAPPSAEWLRRLAGDVDCCEVLCGARARSDGEGELARRLGMLVCAGSGACEPAAVGSALTEMAAFHDPAGFLAALAGGRTLRPQRRRRARDARPRERDPRGPGS